MGTRLTCVDSVKQITDVAHLGTPAALPADRKGKRHASKLQLPAATIPTKP